MDTTKEKHSITPFEGRAEDDFQLWSMRVMAYLEGRELADIVTGEHTVASPADVRGSAAYRKFVQDSKCAREIIISILGDRPLRAIQSSTTPNDMWVKLRERYASTTHNNKIIVLRTLINKRLQESKDMGDHISELESPFNILPSMQSQIYEQMQTALLITSVSSNSNYDSIIAAIKHESRRGYMGLCNYPSYSRATFPS
eukprot:IDg13812t1